LAEGVTLLRALVQQDSINPPGHTVGVAGVAADWLRAQGLPAWIFAAHPDKPNIVVQIDNGPGRHLVFNAHLDTVSPGDVAAWSVPLHDLTLRDGRLYGLGTGNMKGAAAAMMLATRNLARNRAGWSGRISLTLVADECVFGPDGAGALLERRPDLLGDLLICGEGPGSMHLAIAEKGLLWLRLVATGAVGQGMLARPRSAATTRIAAALVALDELNDLVVPCPIPALDHDFNRNGRRVSVNVGRIEGGGFISQAASHAQADIDIRLPPGLTIEDLSKRLDAICQTYGAHWQQIKGWDANWADPGHELVAALQAVAGDVRQVPVQLVTRLPASDASRWRRAGVPAVCYGPQTELASGVDDYVFEKDLTDCVDIYERAARLLLGTGSCGKDSGVAAPL